MRSENCLIFSSWVGEAMRNPYPAPPAGQPAIFLACVLVRRLCAPRKPDALRKSHRQGIHRTGRAQGLASPRDHQGDARRERAQVPLRLRVQ